MLWRCDRRESWGGKWIALSRSSSETFCGRRNISERRTVIVSAQVKEGKVTTQAFVCVLYATRVCIQIDFWRIRSLRYFWILADYVARVCNQTDALLHLTRCLICGFPVLRKEKKKCIANLWLQSQSPNQLKSNSSLEHLRRRESGGCKKNCKNIIKTPVCFPPPYRSVLLPRACSLAWQYEGWIHVILERYNTLFNHAPALAC